VAKTIRIPESWDDETYGTLQGPRKNKNQGLCTGAGKSPCI